MLNLLYAFLLIALLKLVVNTIRYLQGRRYLRMYYHFLANPTWEVTQHKSQIIRLIREAGVEEGYRGVVEPAGWGQLLRVNAPVLENFPNRREDFVELTLTMFNQAIGTYRSRMFETFNPIYWVELVVNLPKILLTYLNVPTESVIIKLAQLSWWVLGTVCGIFYAVYKSEIDQVIRIWIQNLLS